MNIDLWARVRAMFGRGVPPRELQQVLAGWRAQERAGNFGSPVKRELLHPMKGWITDSVDRNPDDRVRHAAHERTRTR
jgi:hypothetical protein